jgi:hypothetical protein
MCTGQYVAKNLQTQNEMSPEISLYSLTVYSLHSCQLPGGEKKNSNTIMAFHWA